jgi:molybdopterin molybdotransferase
MTCFSPHLLPFDQALARLLENTPRLASENMPIEGAAGRVLRQSIAADRDFPPFDRVMMDGYALRSRDLTNTRRFRVSGSAPAGAPVAVLPDEPGVCLEIMTGAPLPVGADVIVPVEETQMVDKSTILITEEFSPSPRAFIHRAGSDASSGEVLLESGVVLDGRAIGIAASCGASVLGVSRLPCIALLATGDELVDVRATPQTHQIRQSNAHALASSLARAGYPVSSSLTISDCESDRLAASTLPDTHDWCLITGAVSKGARDFVPAWLESLGCRQLFHGVAQRPGKPLGCWLAPSGGVVLALPGNPVSALTGLHAFVLPALAYATGRISTPPRQVIPGTGVSPAPSMTIHLPITLDARGIARAATPGNSGDFIGLRASDGFVTIPPGGTTPANLPFTPWT